MTGPSKPTIALQTQVPACNLIHAVNPWHKGSLPRVDQVAGSGLGCVCALRTTETATLNTVLV